VATIAIGDIHGNLPALESLLAEVLPELQPGDHLVFLGDYIDRGPDSRGCVERIVRLRDEAPFRVVTLMGNHEQWMLKSLQDSTRHSWILGMEAFDTIESYSPEAAAILRDAIGELGTRIITDHPRLPYEAFFDAMPRPHLEFFEALEVWHRTPDVLCVHGGFDSSSGPVESQRPDDLIWGTDSFPDAYDGDERVVYGHWGNAVLEGGRPRPRIVNNTFGIDTLAHGVLTALRFPDERVLQSEK
jgi:serine/threonine protein phosphatase 1